MVTNRPAEVFSPGEFIREELEARGWTQGDLAEIMGRPVQVVNGIVLGKKIITPRTAQELAAAFGTSAEMWMNLQTAYSLSREFCPHDEIARRARLHELGPNRRVGMTRGGRDVKVFHGGNRQGARGK
jgi:HTH-type transcriptional regulator/antitoxin HigA